MPRLQHIAALSTALALFAMGPAVASDTPAQDTGASAPAASIVAITPTELEALLDQGNIRLIDVRRDDEVAEGMIPGAEHIALDLFDPAALDLSDGREVVFYCRSGRRSAIAAQRLADFTGKTVRHLGGGILAWEAAGLPITRP